MNLPTKLTVSRILLSIVISILLIFPFYAVGIEFPVYSVSGILVDFKLIIAGVLFILAALTDFLDGRIARKRDLVTDTGKMLDAIADKLLVDSVLVIFTYLQYIHPIVPVVIVMRDVIVDAIRLEVTAKGRVVSAIKTGKIKTVCLMLGIILMFFYNLPFTLMNLQVDLFFLYFGTIMAVVSGFEYFIVNKKILVKKREREIEVI